jgi:hypothetical protein
MVFFHSKNPNLGLFLKAMELKICLYFMPIWVPILRSFGVFYGHLVVAFYNAGVEAVYSTVVGLAPIHFANIF